MDEIFNLNSFQPINSISVSKAKNDLLNALKDLEFLERLNISSTNITSDIEIIYKTKQLSIEETLSKYENKDIKNYLLKKLKQRKSKRLRLKRKAIKIGDLRKKSLEFRDNLHKKIDGRLKEEKEIEIKKKELKDSEKRAEEILYGVTKKKNEAKRYLQVLDSIKDLRRVRSIASQQVDNQQRGFETKINQLKAVWADALNEFDVEEMNLKKIIKGKSKTVEERWRETLFGDGNNNCDVAKDNSQSLQEFVEIRRIWDSCIVPDESPSGSKIPRGWILPNDTASHLWTVYRND